MFDWLFNKEDCKHKYNEVGTLECFCDYDDKSMNVNAYCYECVNCGKRKILREDDFFYHKATLDMFKLWENHQLEFDFTEWNESNYSADKKLEYILNQIKKELKEIDIDLTADNNRIHLNNINAFINNALTEEV